MSDATVNNEKPATQPDGQLRLQGEPGYDLYLCNTAGCTYHGVGHYGSSPHDIGHRNFRIENEGWRIDVEKWGDEPWTVFVDAKDKPLAPSDASLFALALAGAANTCLHLNSKDHE